MSFFRILFCFIFLFSCKDNDVVEVAAVEKTVDIRVERLDKIYDTLSPKNLPKLKAAFPKLFPSDVTDKVWIDMISDPLRKEINAEVQKVFPDEKKFELPLEELISRVKYYFPEEKTPRVITLINEVKTDKKAFYTKDEILISLDCYLGKNHKFYVDFQDYQKEYLEPHQILPDLVTNFAFRKIMPSQDKSLLAEMIYFGRLHYLKDLLLPNVPNHQKIGYSKVKYDWCVANEGQIWAYLIDKKLLYDSNIKNQQRFIEEGPFTKFYLDIDAESPGRVGQWIGWQIVKSYVENNDIPLAELLKKEPLEIFNESKYKPKLEE